MEHLISSSWKTLIKVLKVRNTLETEFEMNKLKIKPHGIIGTQSVQELFFVGDKNITS